MDKKIFFEKYNISEERFSQTGLVWEELLAIKADYENSLNDYSKLALDYVVGKLITCPSVSSFKYRIKDPEHLIEKIIRKRIANPEFVINLFNYKETITDLIGIRVLHLFKNDWLEIGNFIKQEWNLIAPPVKYIRSGDHLAQTNDDCEIKEHPLGYRSVHYSVVINLGTSMHITEIQVRTIFEEAWSEIDHKLRYPYYTDNELLETNSLILNRIAGAADEFATNLVNIKQLIDDNNQVEFNRVTDKRDAEQDDLVDNQKYGPLRIILNETVGKGTIEKFKKIALENKGNDKVYFRRMIDGRAQIIEIGFRVNNSPALMGIIRETFGDKMTVVE